jgi:hypothetical protein
MNKDSKPTCTFTCKKNLHGLKRELINIHEIHMLIHTKSMTTNAWVIENKEHEKMAARGRKQKACLL